MNKFNLKKNIMFREEIVNVTKINNSLEKEKHNIQFNITEKMHDVLI